MAVRTLETIPAARVDPKAMTIMDFSDAAGDQPYVQGENEAGDEYLCGECGFVAIAGLPPDKVLDVVLRCRCGAYNVVMI
ncbi:MAG: hypothetical protein ACLQMH_05930 [Solirubrobacteraceae bacterium]